MVSPSRSRARFTIAALLGAAMLAGCANRGMQPPTDGPRDRGMDSGSMSEGGESDLVGSDTEISDGGGSADDRAQLCTTRFNFENGALYGATDNNLCAVCLTAFQGIANSGAKTVCGGGALEITAAFNGTTGRTTGGEILLPLSAGGGSEDLSGKTITVNVTAVPPGNVSFFLLLSTSGGYENVPGFPLNLTQNQWYTASYKFPSPDGGVPDGGLKDGGIPDGGVPYMWSVYSLSLEAFSYNGYTGKIYVDEIDIK